jgi:hypothetical protein
VVRMEVGSKSLMWEAGVELIGLDGGSFRLVPIAYEFPDTATAPDWLLVLGEVSGHEGSWSFSSAAMTTEEARRVGVWLHSVAERTVLATGPEDEPTFTFMEPNLAFSVASYRAEAVQLRAYFSHGCAAPWLDIDDQLNTYSRFIEFLMPAAEVEVAAKAWLAEIEAFPVR